jgi:deoxyribodipyrimidine photo-lyase
VIIEAGATAVFWNRRYEPAVIGRDREIKTTLRSSGIAVETFNANLLFEPWTIQNQSGQPFKVFTPFWRACSAKSIPEAQGDITLPPPSSKWPHSLKISDLGLEPVVDWAAEFLKVWQPGEAGAHRELKRFLNEGLRSYTKDRDKPALDGTSRLSPHLHFGEISPGEVWRAVTGMAAEYPTAAEAYLRQLIWREFAHHLLYHFPETTDQPLRPEFAAFPWRHDERQFKAWTQGRTGYPLVDAGMRQLWQSGWMHNRVRMMAASFLVKDLLIPWQHGAAWFWDTLVDADLANNTLGWQWVAGCGADAAPYFRIFNPALQASKFDPDRAYVKRWIPELATGNYPEPIIDHTVARQRALDAFAGMMS